MNRFNEDGEIRSKREVMNGIATGAFTKEETKLSDSEISIAYGINHAHRYRGMTPRNESIRRSITAGAAFRGTRGSLSPDPINIPYRRDNNLLPRSDASLEATKTLKKNTRIYRIDITPLRRSKNNWPERLTSLRYDRSDFSLPR